MISHARSPFSRAIGTGDLLPGKLVIDLEASTAGAGQRKRHDGSQGVIGNNLGILTPWARSEIRKPKSETNPDTKKEMTETSSSRFRSFLFWYPVFGFRISVFK
jgi:hypothetical protein